MFNIAEIMCVWDSCVCQIGGLGFLFMRVMSGRLEGIALSVIMLLFQYNFNNNNNNNNNNNIVVVIISRNVRDFPV